MYVFPASSGETSQRDPPLIQPEREAPMHGAKISARAQVAAATALATQRKQQRAKFVTRIWAKAQAAVLANGSSEEETAQTEHAAAK